MVGEAKTTDNKGTAGLRMGPPESGAEDIWGVLLRDTCEEGRKAGLGQGRSSHIMHFSRPNGELWGWVTLYSCPLMQPLASGCPLGGVNPWARKFQVGMGISQNSMWAKTMPTKDNSWRVGAAAEEGMWVKHAVPFTLACGEEGCSAGKMEDMPRAQDCCCSLFAPLRRKTSS